MSNSYNNPLSGVKIEDIIDTPDGSSTTTGDKKPMKNRNESIAFSIINNYGKLSSRKSAPSFMLIDWDGYKRYDLRAWNDDYSVPFKGLSFTEDEVGDMYEFLSEYIHKSYSSPLHTVDMGKTKAKIYYVVGQLSSSTVKGVEWSKQITIVDWGYGQKFDFRKWTADYSKCSKGVCLTQEEVDSLVSILKTLDL